MAIAYEDKGADGIKSGTAGTIVSPAYPAAVNANDVCILHCSQNGGTAPSTLTGWTLVFRETTVSNPKISVWIRVCDGSEDGATVDVTVGGVVARASILRFSGVDTTTPQDVAAATLSRETNSTSVVIPEVTTVTADTVLVYTGASNSSTATFTGPAGSTERFDYGANKSGFGYTEPRPATGATGTRTVTSTSNTAASAVLIALRPAAGGGTTLLAAAALTASATVGASASLTLGGAAALTASATASAAAGMTLGVGAALAAAATLAASAGMQLRVAATLAASAAMAPSAVLVLGAQAPLTATATLVPVAYLALGASAPLTATATLAAVARFLNETALMRPPRGSTLLLKIGL